MRDLRTRKNCIVILSLALFSFLFLGIEFLYDDCLAAIGIDSAGVVNAQNWILGISVLGYLVYPLLSNAVSEKLAFILSGTGFIVILVSVYFIQTGTSYGVIFGAGAICFLLLGCFGNGVCFLATQVISDFKLLARIVGVSYAVGVLLQYIHTNWMKGTPGKMGMLCAGCILFCGLLIWQKTKTEGAAEILYREQKETFEIDKPILCGVLLVLAVALMTCLFSTLDNAVTLVHSSGDYNIGQWPRLILALSGLTAGFLYDMWERKYMIRMMYFVSILAMIAIVILTFDGPFLIGLIVFYISAGFFVVFFTTGFMDLSVHTPWPKLWAGLGRAVNNLCALATTAISVALLAADSIVVMIVALIILAGISVVILAYEKQLKWDTSVEETKPVETKDVAMFAREFHLTEREEELLRIFLQSEDPVQDVAAQMAISRAALYRHIQALNEKTGTKTRVGIIQCFYQWSREK